MSRNSILAASILAGTMIGAGIFSLPYVFNEVGILAGFFYLVFFASVYVALYLMYAAVLRTREGRHDFSYFADLYLPKKISGLASLAILAETRFRFFGSSVRFSFLRVSPGRAWPNFWERSR
ncbi:MAG: hypothetical protein UY32_C0013G0049 [Candidatus Jorgensenbacteria bacterium GW2011_GWC1_48_8]|uniref:Uncharacterized protein n=1 Tax=Candidatus Jorgensenbacteria bacterium GW2011_GWC1_48_8 TaxID=1618666 RepID=A0A0G1UXG4_9BACT|nr:MAG: hypothetical protein UY32_C0013G0049 [Candidatus Jorgensenbacteria bacterium GW2011_GWC1_48_8]